MKKIIYSLSFACLLFIGCSSEETGTTDTNEEVMENGDNPTSSTNSTPSNDISTLFLAGMSRCRSDENQIPIVKGSSVTIRGNSNYYEELGLNEETSIFSITGGSYNVDGSIPMTERDIYFVYSTAGLERNNVTISFVIIDEASANAEIIIDEPLTFAVGTPIPFRNTGGRPIEGGKMTIKVKEERLTDDITPFGKDVDGNIFQQFVFQDEVVSKEDEHRLNAMKYHRFAEGPVDFLHPEIAEMFGETGNTIHIKVIETAIVQKGERLELVKPQNFQ